MLIRVSSGTQTRRPMSLLTKGHYSAIDLHCINLSKIYREHMQDFAVRLSRGKIY